MIHFDDFYRALEQTSLAPRIPDFRAAIDARYQQRIHGDHRHWQAAYDALPEIRRDRIDIDQARVSAYTDTVLSAPQRQRLEQSLRALHPWRKGPFSLFGVDIDTEWRSDWKWRRLAPHISSLSKRKVLDVGCGNAYHGWRMAAAGAKLAVGIDPSQKFMFQFHAIKKYLGAQPVYYLPLRSQDLPASLGGFDTVFSMGVLYHRRSPFQHLEELKLALKPGGELVLETLIIEGGPGQVLVPGERYAQMRNVWFIPSADELMNWLLKSGFEHPRLIDVSQTGCDEQRSTDWMHFHSLSDFLDPTDPNRTVEGYPAPRRAIIIARRPDRRHRADTE